MNDRPRFDKWAELASASLRRYWNKRSPQNLAYGHSRKLLDLLLKRLCLCPEVADLDSVAKCLHVPLDSYSLRLIRPHARKAVIPADASMGFIRDRSTYHAVQHDIREICDEAGVPPIAFDLLAWDEEHHTYATAVGLR